MERAASQFGDGELLSAEIIEKRATPELAYIVEAGRDEAGIDGSEEMSPWTLRATLAFGPEGGEQKVVHRHADTITTSRAAESPMQD